MDIPQIISLGATILAKIRIQPSSPPNQPSIAELYGKIRTDLDHKLAPISANVAATAAGSFPPAALPLAKTVSKPTDVSTACLSCSRAHLAAVAGALNEALRFAREDGVGDSEAVQRVNLAENEITIMERIDLSPAKIAATSPAERAVVEAFLPRIRSLRQKISNITTLQDLETAAVEAEILANNLRLAHLQSKGVDVKGIVQLADKVKNHEISMEQAQKQVHNFLPPGNSASDSVM